MPRAGGQPARKPLSGAALNESTRRWRSRSTNPVTNRVGCSAVADTNECSSSPIAVGAPRRDKWSTRGRPWSRTAAMAVCQDTPKARATSATERPTSPTRRQISARACSVSAARGATSSLSSDQVPTAQSGSGSAKALWPTPAPPGGRPWVGLAPSVAGDRDPPLGPRTPDSPPPSPSSPPPTTTHRRLRYGHRPRTPASRDVPSRPRYGASPSVASCCAALDSRRIARPDRAGGPLSTGAPHDTALRFSA
jgi:hypothetical protein